jgi:8-oxo-dGTP pyrophosphatase MutT (NUDIX family)
MYSAGVMPYAVVDGKVYILLGMDRRDGSWSDFGGRSEAGDTSPCMTAAREFYEETTGSVMLYQASIKGLDGVVPWKSLTVGKNEYFMYPLRIPYSDAYPRSFDMCLALADYAKMHKKFTEKTQIAWFSIDSIVEVLTVKRRDMRLRFIFADTLRRNVSLLKNISQDSIPKEDGRQGVRPR